MATAKVKEVQIVEVEKEAPLEAMTPELASHIQALQYHPGHIYLARKLRFEIAALSTTLKRTRHKDLRDVDFLQAGIYWAEWLDARIAEATGYNKRQSPARSPLDAELEAFREVQKQVEIVG